MLDAVTVELRKGYGGQLVVLSPLVELALGNVLNMREQQDDPVTVDLPRHQLELVLGDLVAVLGLPYSSLFYTKYVHDSREDMRQVSCCGKRTVAQTVRELIVLVRKDHRRVIALLVLLLAQSRH